MGAVVSRLERLPRFVLAALVFVGVLGVYLVSPIRTPFDSRWTIHTAASIVHHGDTDLDEYDSYLRTDDYYAIERMNGHVYNRYPIGTTLLAVPFVGAIDLLATILPTPSTATIIERGKTPPLEMAIASVLVALGASIMFLVGIHSGLDAAGALLLAVTFAFGSAAWSIGSRALWQHGPSMLLLAAALYAFVRGRSRPWITSVASLPLAFGLVVRPTNGIALGILTGYVALAQPKALWAYLLGIVLVMGPFISWNYAHYGRAISPYYLPSGQPAGAPGDFPLVLLGHLVSPSRGLFIVSPVFLFSLVGFATYAGQRDSLGCAIALVALIQLLVVSSAGQWWAGHSYGSRFLADLTPFFCYGLIPPIRWILSRASRTATALGGAFALLLLWSALAHGRAATTWDVWAWNGEPISVDDRPDRVWDWSDIQMLRGIAHRAGR